MKKLLMKPQIFALAWLALHPLATMANASGFHPWEVTNVAWGDVLNVRKYPSSKSQILTAYQNGVRLQMTGQCTGGFIMDSAAHLDPQTQVDQVRYRWCKVWVNPAGNEEFVAGWIYGKYIQPIQ